MGISTGYSVEFSSKIPAAKLFQCAIIDAHEHAPLACPNIISKVTDLPGFTRIFHQAEGLPFDYKKYRVEVFDRENLEYKYTLIEGEDLGKKYSSAMGSYKLMPSPEGGCVCKLTEDYTTIPGVQFTEEDIGMKKEEAVAFFNAIEKYLLQNVDGHKTEHGILGSCPDTATKGPLSKEHIATAIGLTKEIVCKVAAARMFKVWCMDIHNAAPKIMPRYYSGASRVEGDGGAGTVFLFNFTQECPYSYVKERIDMIDKENFEWVISITDGWDFGKKITSATFHVKFIPLDDGGSIFKTKIEYNVIPGVGPEEYIKANKGYFLGVYEALETYLLAHPDEYA